VTKNLVRIMIVASIFLGCAALFFSQVSAVESRLIPKNMPSFADTVNVPFNEYGIPECFSFQVFIDKPDSYVVVFGNSDLLIDEVNITAPDHSGVILNRDLSFYVMRGGLYMFSVAGHYSLAYPYYKDESSHSYPTFNQPFRTKQGVPHDRSGGITGDQDPQLDETTEVSIFGLAEKTVLVHPYSYLLYAGLCLLASGIVLCLVTWKPRLSGLRK